MGGEEEEGETTHFGSSMGLTYMIVKIHPVLVPPLLSGEDKFFNV